MEFISTTSRNLSSKDKIGQERKHKQQYLGSWGVDKLEECRNGTTSILSPDSGHLKSNQNKYPKPRNWKHRTADELESRPGVSSHGS